MIKENQIIKIEKVSYHGGYNLKLARWRDVRELGVEVTQRTKSYL